MRLFGRTSDNPYMASDKGLANPRPDLLQAARYQIVPGPRGLPMAQAELRFRRDLPAIANPDMTLAVLLDRSGSMREAFAEGHVYNVAAAILTHVQAAGVGFDLVFYDDQVSDAGPITSHVGLQSAVRANGPRGGTYVTAAIRRTIQKYKTRPGLYVIVITDGEFADKTQVEQLVLKEMVPAVTPDDPYAFRLHFVGAGEGVDHAFLRQIEADAAGQGVPLVTQHHHAHLSHSHASILDELDRAFLGVGTGARFGEQAVLLGAGAPTAGTTITHTTDPLTRRTWDGPVGDLDFLPRRVVLGCEYGASHPDALPIAIQFNSPDGRRHDLAVPVPLPRQTTAAVAGEPARKPGFHLPWVHRTPEQEEARTEADRQRTLVMERAAAVHEQEMQRQRTDLTTLATGGLPIQAVERLKEIGRAETGEGLSFTSDLSPEEAGLLRREGYTVLGLVTGSAMYHVGQAYASSQGDCEVDVLSKAYDKATDLAVGRLRQELKIIGAHGVVGVRLSVIRHEWADKTIEVSVIGTGVRAPGRAPTDPWMCDLSGQEWWALHRAGYEPAALVWGHCTWFILTTQQDEWIERSWVNSELTHWSQALGTARRIAMGHVVRLAREHNGTGIAGVRIERRLDEVRLSGPGEDPAYEREHHNLVISVIGTAIRLRPDAPAGVTPTVQVLSLRDGRIAPVALGASDVKME